MPISTDEKSGGIPVKIYPKMGEVDRGMLYYRKEGPVLESDNSNVIDDLEGVKFSFSENSQLAKSAKINPSDQINLRSELVVELSYSPDKTSQFEMYPPSTDSWLAHVVDSGNKSIFTVQRLSGNEKRLLTIVDKISLDLQYIGIIQSFEPSILMMNRDWNVYNELLYSDTSDADIYDILKKESISWSALSKLVEGVIIPNLTIGNTMEETLNQLVPQSSSPSVRKQIMAFLGWLETAEIPKVTT